MNSTSAFAFPLGSPYVGIEYKIFYSLNIVELICHFLLDCPFSALNFFLIFKTSILHPNLKVILLCQSACLFLRGIGRISLIFGRFMIGDMATRGSFSITLLYSSTIFVRNFIVNVMVIERIMATIFWRTYEHRRFVGFNLGWLSITLILSFYNAYSYGTTEIGLANRINSLTYAALIVLGLLEIVAFLLILKFNEREYKKKSSGRYNLSQKYQLSENIRTAKQLIPTMFLHFLNLFGGALHILFGLFGVYGPNPFWPDLYLQNLYIFATIDGFLIELSMITFHPFLKRNLQSSWEQFLAKICKCYSAIGSKRNKTHVAPILRNEREILGMDMLGRPMALQPTRGENVGDEYFRQFEMAWESGGKQSIQNNKGNDG